MTMQIAASSARQREALTGILHNPCPSRMPFRSIRRAAPMLTVLLLVGALAGCGGSESSQASGNAGASSKALKAVEGSTDSSQSDVLDTAATEGDESAQGNAQDTAQGDAEGTVTAAANGSSGVNTIDTVVRDMRDLNDFTLRGYEGEAYGWYVGPGSTHMGNNPQFTNSIYWSTFGNDSAYSGLTAKAMLPWLAVFDGVNHNASNVAVEFRNMRAYVKSKASGGWRSLGGPAKVTGTVYGKPNTGLGPQNEVVVNNSDSSSSIRMGEDSRYWWHGWWEAGRPAIDPWDVGAFFVTVQARLVVANSSGADDRRAAELGLQIGADYYMETYSDYGDLIAPNIGISRTKKLTNEWQAFSYTTLSDVGEQIPGGGITEAELRGSPPPLE